MATKKKAAKKKTSSGSGPKSKRIVKNKMKSTMHEFKHHELESGRSGKKVKNPKQAIAIGLSEARRAGADIPPSPNQRKRGKKTASKKTASKKTSAKKKSAAKKSSRR
ncbi:MAG: histone H1-like protein [Acidobacteriaceae bacterium]|nr:histone H1-like protein [Acidobacteriaceae bacterium]